MKEKNRPDKLAQEVSQAIAAGLSYGKWKALQPVVAVEPQAIPDGWQPCEYCGKPFKRVGGKRYCEAYCRLEAYNARRRKEQAEK
jgi:hypothetical protein